MLREEIRWVGFAVDFPKVDTPEPHGLLYPQVVGVQVPPLAKPLSGTDAYDSA